MQTPYGDILDVDLDSGRIERRSYDTRVAALLMAGSGFCHAELAARLEPGIDAAGPANPLILACGLLAATEAPASGRTMVAARSPLTGLIGLSNLGGGFGVALRAAGLQGLVVRGAAPAPVTLRIGPTGGTIEGASALWGMDTERALEALTSPEAERECPPAALVIGPAGERQVRFASAMSQAGHAAGRTGMGAVMGAKRLKAIVVDHVEGHRQPASAEAREAARRYNQRVMAADRFAFWRRFGSGTVEDCSRAGMLGTRNFRQGVFEHAAAADAATLDGLVVKRRGCPRCPVHCKAEMILSSDRHRGDQVERPEFESLCAWGARVGVSDGQDVVHLSALCDTLGLDTISTAAAVGFAIDLLERGLIDGAVTAGLDLSWGDVELIEVLIRQIASRQGIGDILADGVRYAAARLGGGAEEVAFHVKGLELSAYEPRGSRGTQLALAVANRGADYAAVYLRHEDDCTAEQAARLYGDAGAADRRSSRGKAAMVRRGAIVGAALDALGLCKVPALSLINDYDLVAEAELAAAVTGLALDAEELFTVGERIVTLGRLVNLGLGATARDDELPQYFADNPLPDGPGAGLTAQVKDLVAEYYQLMGWSSDGVPTAATIRRLGLGELATRAAPSGDAPESPRLLETAGGRSRSAQRDVHVERG
jgi:aldehyde:ferredoxin oxidoreductase